MCSVPYEHMFPRLVILLLAVSLIVGIAARPSGSAGKPSQYVVKPIFSVQMPN